MILHFMQCDTCDEKHRFEPMMGPAWSQMPHDWLVLMTGDRGEDGRLFCSTECLKKHLGVSEPVQPLEQPQTKMRRFLLVDEEANETECVQWNNGCVTIDPEKGQTGDVWFYRDWEEFKAVHPGCGVTWIDQEVQSDG